jgi:amino acid adenylation domain-containing protein
MSEIAARQKLFQQLREKKAALVGASEGIPRRSSETPPLSFGQQRLWFLEQLEPGNPRFNILTVVRMKGPTRPDFLRDALNEIIRRHESLRTLIEVNDGRPVQRVLPELKVDIPQVDLSALGEPARESLLHRIAAEEARRPFDFVNGPFFRAVLLLLGEQHCAFVLVMHQIVVDRWSRGILVQEIVSLYEAFSDGRRSPLPELPIQYADFAEWQRARLQGEHLDKLLSYWKEQLAPPVPVLDLPTDFPRPALQGHRGRMQYYVIPERDIEPFKAVCQKENATLFMGLLAVFSVLLYRYSGQTDFVVGSPIANRNRKEISELIGFFLNMLAMRVRMRDEMTFAELLQHVKQVSLGAYDRQELPFERLVEELGCERSLSHHPLFQVSMVLQNAPIPPLNLRNLTASLVEVDWGTTAFDLSFFFWETEMWESLERGLSLVTSCNAELFTAGTITRMVGHFKNLLSDAALHPEHRISDLRLLSTEEMLQILHEWNDPAAPIPQETIPRIFERVVERQPDSVAIEFGRGRLTYRDLDRLANRVARRIRAGQVVAVSTRSAWRAIVRMLGILKAGGTYLPIDPSEPAARRARMMETDIPGAPACVLFTSGSTGEPKGVLVPHSAIVRLAFSRQLSIQAGESVGQASNLAFDAASYEIWGTLLQGGTLVEIDRMLSLSPAELGGFLADRKISVLFLPTALFNRIAAENPEIFRTLRMLLVGGETAEPESFRKVLAQGSPQRLLHVYGPTESTTFATAFEVKEIAPGASTVPIGNPIDNTEVYVLDSRGGLVPAGIRGEIHLGGEGLALGYAARPDLTAERFVPNPFSDVPGSRLFRTGDLGRHRQDGNIEILGRLDRQLKIRGFRVEPGEVEAALVSMPPVRQALVVPRKAADDLVAYVVADTFQEEQLLASLRRRLPAFMIPSAILRLDSLPLTAHGKIDASALPGAENREPASPVPPRNEMERLVAGIWEEILGRPFGAHDDFFEAGGHSLHATRVISRLRAALAASGTPVSVRDLFELRTVAALADLLTASCR